MNEFVITWQELAQAFEDLDEIFIYCIPNNFHCVGKAWWVFIVLDICTILAYFLAFAG